MTTKISTLCYFVILQLAGCSMEEPGQFINKLDAARMEVEMSKRGPGFGTEWIVMPDGEGQPQIAYMQYEPTRSAVENTLRDETTEYDIGQDIKYRVYTRKNPKKGHEISLRNKKSLKSSPFQRENPTKIVIHGWKSSGDSSTVTNIKDAYLSRSDVNVIGVDWSNIASSNYYLTPASEAPNVGEHLAKVIETLYPDNSRGVGNPDIHIIGHSLGAHAAGAAGSKSSVKIARITGLDPALPGFQYWQGPSGRLDKSDASFVEVIHTCSGALGMSEPVGHADFYPNGGSPFQPGCCCLAEFTEACSHGRAHQYFAESIRSNVGFQASPCSTWDNFKSGYCGSGTAVMGEQTTASTRGVYYLLTNSSPPFALGPTGSKYFEYEDY